MGEVKKQGKNRSVDTRWKKGQSGNPKGRPENRYSLTVAMREYLKDHPEILDEITQRTAKDAAVGKPHALDKVWSYMDGKAPQPIGKYGDDGEIVDQNITVNFVKGNQTTLPQSEEE